MMGKPDNCSFVKLYHRLHIDFSATPLWNRRGLRRGGSKSADAPRPQTRRLRTLQNKIHSFPFYQYNTCDVSSHYKDLYLQIQNHRDGTHHRLSQTSAKQLLELLCEQCLCITKTFFARWGSTPNPLEHLLWRWLCVPLEH